MFLLALSTKWFYLVVLALPVIAVITLFILGIVSQIHLATNFNKLKIGMTFDEVKSILGSPDFDDNIDDVVVWKWEEGVLRGRLARTAYFKNGLLHSKSEN